MRWVIAYDVTDDRGRLAGTLHPPHDAWRSRRYRQYLAAQQPHWQLGRARRLVGEKIASMRLAARSWQRHGKLAGLGGPLAALPRLEQDARAAVSPDRLLGFEGHASKL